MIKAAFFDIDGTLIDPGTGRVPSSTIDSLAALRRHGVKLFVATGRIPSMMTFLEDVFPFDGFVALNGQLVIDREGHVLHRMTHDSEDIRRLVDLVQRDPFPCLIIEEKESFAVTDSPVIQEHFRWAGLSVPPLYDLSRLENHPVLQFLAYIRPEEKIRLAPLKHIEITSASAPIFDVIPQGGGKEVGAAAAARQFGFSREEVAAFGDGANDARLIQWAGLGVAMGNGGKAAKMAADYVTAPVGEQGIKKAMLHLGLLSPKDFL